MGNRKKCSEASGIFQDIEKRNRFVMSKSGEREGTIRREKQRQLGHEEGLTERRGSSNGRSQDNEEGVRDVGKDQKPRWGFKFITSMFTHFRNKEGQNGI